MAPIYDPRVADLLPEWRRGRYAREEHEVAQV